jgi:hypothetical protein
MHDVSVALQGARVHLTSGELPPRRDPNDVVRQTDVLEGVDDVVRGVKLKAA